MATLLVDGQRVEARADDSLLVAMLRAGLHPTGGGCLCLAGDCPNCLVTVDGVAYTRSCQVPARDGMAARRDHLGEQEPALLSDQAGSPLRGIAPDAGEDAGAPGGQNSASPSLPTEGAVQVRHVHSGEDAGAPSGQPTDSPRFPTTNAAPVRHVHCDTVVIGQGDSGRTAARDARDAGLDVVTLDAHDGQHVTGVYPGPLVVAADQAGRVLHVHPRREIVVATGAAEIQPVVPGSDLEGIVTARAAAELVAAGIELGRAVAVGERPAGLPERALTGHFAIGRDRWELVRFEGNGRVEAVVLRRHGDADAAEERIECDTAVLGLGRNPRNALARMASDLPVRVVGSAGVETDLPPCPRAGTVCPCSGVTFADLDDVWERGFREMELLKRATLAGTGTCQGGVCLPYLRSFLLERGGRLQPAFTARPLNRQLTVRELAAGAHTAVTARSPLHDEHLSLGARMDRAGGWWRPWTYGGEPAPEGAAGAFENANPLGLNQGEPVTVGRERALTTERPTPRRTGERDEYRAARERVSLGDVSSLGKMAIAGTDAEAFLERIVPTRVATIRPGRCRYVLMLDERGYLLDDGMLCREADRDVGDRFFLTSTSGGSGFFELWLRDWAEAFGCDVRILNQTASLAAINVTGPQAARLLARAGARELPAFGRHQAVRVAGVDCRVVRLSFTGELSYELHHPAADARKLWRRLLAAGAEFNVQPHGLQALLNLRLEKGHIVVGQDTDYDSTPRRLAHEWAVNLDKGDFVGRQAIVRTNKQPLDRRLAMLELTGKRVVPADAGRSGHDETRNVGTLEGSTIFHGGAYVGYVTSAPTGGYGGGNEQLGTRDRPPTGCADVPVGLPKPSPLQSGACVLAWVNVDRNGALPPEVTIRTGPQNLATTEDPAPDSGPSDASERPTDAAIGVWSARPVDSPPYDPDGSRARVKVDLASEPASSVRPFDRPEPQPTKLAAADTPEPPRLRRLEASRVSSTPEALDLLVERPPWTADALAFRTAPDELLVTATPGFKVQGDRHAIVERETAFSYVWLDEETARRLLDRECEWRRPDARAAFAQGEVAGIPAKLRFEVGRTLILVPAPFAAAFQRRLSRALDRDAGEAP